MTRWFMDPIVSPEFLAAFGRPAHFVVRPTVLASERSFEDLGQESEGWVVFFDLDRPVCPSEREPASDLLTQKQIPEWRSLDRQPTGHLPVTHEFGDRAVEDRQSSLRSRLSSPTDSSCHGNVLSSATPTLGGSARVAHTVTALSARVLNQRQMYSPDYHDHERPAHFRD
jgi:hypothetical protein